MKITLIRDAHQTAYKSKALLLVVLALLVTGCGKDKGDGDVLGAIELPTDDTKALKLNCENVGIHRETCILDDPNNPYVNVIVSQDTKFDLDAEAPSATAKFYMWGTALARGAGAPGENQFYVALNLHRMWASSDSEQTRLQALKAYRSYLDNYFNSVTFFEIPLDSDEFFPQSLNLWTGQLLFDPTALTNTFTSTRLFSSDPDINKSKASQEVGEWGYFYDQDAQLFTKNF